MAAYASEHMHTHWQLANMVQNGGGAGPPANFDLQDKHHNGEFLSQTEERIL